MIATMTSIAPARPSPRLGRSLDKVAAACRRNADNTGGSVADLIPAEFEVLDPRFAGTGGDRSIARLFSTGRWLEGPGYHAAGRFVLFSDIPNDRILRY